MPDKQNLINYRNACAVLRKPDITYDQECYWRAVKREALRNSIRSIHNV